MSCPQTQITSHLTTQLKNVHYLKFKIKNAFKILNSIYSFNITFLVLNNRWKACWAQYK